MPPLPPPRGHLGVLKMCQHNPAWAGSERSSEVGKDEELLLGTGTGCQGEEVESPSPEVWAWHLGGRSRRLRSCWVDALGWVSFSKPIQPTTL